MDIIKVGEPVVTKMGTVVSRYIENGRLYKSIDFQNSANKYAKQKGLVKTVVQYGEKNKPESVFDTFERKIKKIAPEIANDIKNKQSLGNSKNTVKTKSADTAVSREKLSPEKSTAKPKAKTQPTKQAENLPLKSCGNEKLVPISANSFKRETSKKLYSKIHQYVKLIGHNGSLTKDVKIMSVKGSGDSKQAGTYSSNNDADIMLSLKRKGKLLHLILSRKEIKSDKNHLLLEAIFNEDGQMINGRFPYKNLTFERYGANIRRIKCYDKQYTPVADNDREWDCAGRRISGSCEYINRAEDDNSVGGAFELFIEFARLYTSIFK